MKYYHILCYISVSSANLHLPRTNLFLGFHSLRIAAPTSANNVLPFIYPKPCFHSESISKRICFRLLLTSPMGPLIHLLLNDNGDL